MSIENTIVGAIIPITIFFIWALVATYKEFTHTNTKDQDNER